MRNKRLLRISIMIVLAFIVISCSPPVTKDAYLEKFGAFIKRVEKNYRDYKKRDWEWANARFEKFSKTWYDQFRDQLSIDEKIKVAGMVLEYESFKELDKTGNFYKKYLKRDIEAAQEDMKEYMEKDFSKDLDKFIEGAREIGDSALRVLDDISTELKKKRENRD